MRMYHNLEVEGGRVALEDGEGEGMVGLGAEEGAVVVVVGLSQRHLRMLRLDQRMRGGRVQIGEEEGGVPIGVGSIPISGK